MTKAERAQKLYDIVVEKIETGEFTPAFGWLREDYRLGPCGCAVSGAAYALGLDSKESYRTECEDVVLASRLASIKETRMFECGFEGWAGGFDVDLTNPFYKAGAALHGFKY